MNGTNHIDTTDRSSALSRRRFLSVAAGGTFAGIGGLGSAAAQSKREEIRLGGKITGWQGRAPDAIAGETNPTLNLEPGTDHRVVWKNLDGMGHNFALLDGDGNVLERTEVMSEKGATQSIEFTARKEMAEYVCEPHITSMHGTIAVGGSNNASTPTPTEDEGSDVERFMPWGASVRFETIADGGLVAPVDFEVPPGDDRRFITDRFGQVYLHTDDGLREEPYVDVSDRLAEIGGEKGLLGMAFHPEFQSNGRFFLRYSAPLTESAPDSYSHTEVLAEFRATDGSAAGASFERRLLEIPSPQDTHNAGSVTFGPDDGYLYMGMGDGGGAHDTDPGHVEDWYERNEGGNGQDVTENLLGSVLRIDVDSREGDKPYAIPDGNPLVGEPGLDEQFAWGFRNPWRMGFSSGKLFVADVGQNMFEEVNIVEEDKNYGWNVREGTHCFKPGPKGSRNPPEECPSQLPPDVRGGERLIDPVIEYPHTYQGQGVGSAVIGGYVYENDAIPAIEGKYVFGDYRKTKETEIPTGSLFAATPTDDGLWELEELVVENTENGTVGAYLLAIGRDNDGGLYALTSRNPGGGSTGAVHRIRPPQNAAQPTTAAPTTTPHNGSAGNTTATDTTAGNSTSANTTTNTTTGNTTETGSSTTNATTTNATATNATTSTTPATTAVTEAGDTETTATTATATETTTTGRAGNETTANETTATRGNESTGDAAGSSGSGPGFGVLAALSGLTIGAARLLSGRDD